MKWKKNNQQQLCTQFSTVLHFMWSFTSGQSECETLPNHRSSNLHSLPLH